MGAKCAYNSNGDGFSRAGKGTTVKLLPQTFFYDGMGYFLAKMRPILARC